MDSQKPNNTISTTFDICDNAQDANIQLAYAKKLDDILIMMHEDDEFDEDSDTQLTVSTTTMSSSFYRRRQMSNNSTGDGSVMSELTRSMSTASTEAQSLCTSDDTDDEQFRFLTLQRSQSVSGSPLANPRNKYVKSSDSVEPVVTLPRRSSHKTHRRQPSMHFHPLTGVRRLSSLDEDVPRTPVETTGMYDSYCAPRSPSINLFRMIKSKK
ncbi:hypothetical protein MP228_008459 [Amoeboaphelidium protococcarum]|nr:hypothetical protein MP228_008459 [Amoeboaphelidium protococcarum]